MLRTDCAGLDFVAINELATVQAIEYLSSYDSTHGRFPGRVRLQGSDLHVQAEGRTQQIALSAFADAGALPWNNLDIDLLLECSGQVTSEQQADAYLQTGAGRILLSNPAAPPVPAFVFGVNHGELQASQAVVSAASCTSNALVPVLKVLHQQFGIENGIVTTVHASMHDQPVIDAYHSEDLRRNRAASQSIIPVNTGLAAGIGRIMPELEGRFAAHALRVPVNNVSALNITANLETAVSEEAVNRAMRNAEAGQLAGVLGVCESPLASCDFNGDSRSGIIDAAQTRVSGERTVNLLAWFDNEWAFANRMLDLALLMSRQ